MNNQDVTKVVNMQKTNRYLYHASDDTSGRHYEFK